MRRCAYLTRSASSLALARVLKSARAPQRFCMVHANFRCPFSVTLLVRVQSQPPCKGCSASASPRFAPDQNKLQVHAYLEASLGPQRLRHVQASLCSPPLETCMRINTIRCSREDAMAELRDSVRDGGFAGVSAIEAHPSLDAVVRFRGSGPNAIDFDAAGAPLQPAYARASSQHVSVAASMRDTTPPHINRVRWWCAGLKEVVVTRKAGEAVLRGAHVFAPGVLAVSKGLAAGEQVAVSVAREMPGARANKLVQRSFLRSSSSQPCVCDLPLPTHCGCRGAQQPEYSVTRSSCRRQERVWAHSRLGHPLRRRARRRCWHGSQRVLRRRRHREFQSTQPFCGAGRRGGGNDAPRF